MEEDESVGRIGLLSGVDCSSSFSFSADSVVDSSPFSVSVSSLSCCNKCVSFCNCLFTRRRVEVDRNKKLHLSESQMIGHLVPWEYV